VREKYTSQCIIKANLQLNMINHGRRFISRLCSYGLVFFSGRKWQGNMAHKSDMLLILVVSVNGAIISVRCSLCHAFLLSFF